MWCSRSALHTIAKPNASCTIAQRGGLFPAAANALSLDRLETVEASLLRKTTARTAMRNTRRFPVVGVLIVLMMICFGTSPATAQPRAHVYLLRGLMNIFSLGMDSLAVEIQHYGIYATVHNHGEWQTLADQAAAAYHAGREGPIIIIGHSLGADAVMEMSAYLGRKGVPVALAVPFDAKQSYATPSNVGRLLNLTHVGYGYMSRGVGFQGPLSNVDVSRDSSIDHLNIDKSPRLHRQVLAAVLAVVGKGGGTESGKNGIAKPSDSTQSPAKPTDGVTHSESAKQ
jgi:hypothetical protein